MAYERTQTALQAIRGQVDSDTPPLSRPIAVRDLRSAKRLLSRLIVDLQRGTIRGQEAKDLCYLLSVFMQLTRDFEMQERMEKLENRVEQTLTNGREIIDGEY